MRVSLRARFSLRGRFSLRARVLLVLAGTAAVSITTVSVFQNQTLAGDLERAAAVRVQRSARAAHELSRAHLEALQQRYRAVAGSPQLRANLEGDVPTLAHYAAELRARQGAERILFLDARGRKIAAAGDEQLDADAAVAALPALRLVHGQLYAVGSVPLETGGQPLGRLVAYDRVSARTLRAWSRLCGATVRIGPTDEEQVVAARVQSLGGQGLWVVSSLAAESEALAGSRWNLVRGGALALAGALLLSLVLTPGLTEPIRILRDAAERIGRGELSARVSVARRDEIGDLSVAVNEMAARFEEHDQTLQRTNSDLVAVNRELVVEKERALAASRAKSDFLANMSHEIRTPLAALLGFTELLVDQQDLHDDARDSLAAVQRNGDHLLRLVNDLLDLSSIEAGRLRVERRRCSLAAVIDHVVSIMRGRAEGKGLEFVVDCGPSLPAEIETDATRLRQILVNLLGNAIKFTERGSVHLRVRLERAQAGRLTFEVVDTGIGIPPDYRPRLFEPFSQADTSASRRFGGTGLGLAISRRLVENLGGAIEVESEPGRGSRFRFWIDPGPLTGEPLGTRAAPRAEPTRGTARRGSRVLLAEDSPDNQRLVSTILRRAGHEVELAIDGEAAVERVLAALEAEEPFDVVLMDMQMPRLDGYEATARLRRAGYSGPIVALTAHAMPGDREKCIHAGCDDFATKPIDRTALLDLVGRYVRKPEGAA